MKQLKSNITHWFPSRPGAARRATLGVAACLVACGCGSDPESPGTSSERGSAPRAEEGVEVLGDEFPVEPERIAAELSIRGNALILSLQNLTDTSGAVSVSTVVENSSGIYFTEHAGEAKIAPNEQLEIALSASDIDGLDRMMQDWTDVRVSFQYELTDGSRGGMPVALFAERGIRVVQREIVSSGKAFGFPALATPLPELVDKQVGTFQMCFANVVTHSGVTENNLDFHRNPTQMVFAAGMRLSSRQPNGTVLPNRFLDFNGCTQLPRQTGTWTFALGLTGQNFPVAGVTMTARRTDALIPNRQATAVIDANFAPPRLSFTMAAGQDAQLQTAYAAVLHTVLRATSLGAAVRASDLILQMGAAGSGTNYTHSTRTIAMNPTTALSRRTISHETGHWIHRNWQSTPQDLTYCAAGTPDCTTPPADDCTRTPDGTHGFLTVEWNATAHVEGIANFFSALAFNTASAGANCFLPDTGSTSCEAMGKTLETGLTGNGPCFEWFDDKFFDTGAQLDWAKMYWDFVADEGQNFVTYLTNERARTGWTKKNHSAKIFEGLSNTMNQALRRAAIGNIQEGAAH